MKRVLSLLFIMVFIVVGCQSGDSEMEGNGDATVQEGIQESSTENGTSESEGESASTEVSLPYPEETIKIAVEIYDPTDGEFLAMKDYFDYLTQTFNVEFTYSEAITSAEHELEFIENSTIAGADALLAYYNVSGVEQVAKALEYDMYYWGMGDDPEISEEFKNDPMYLGSINYGDGEFIGGYELGKYVIEEGARSIVYSSGGADFGAEMFVKRRDGFMTAVEEAKAEGIELEIIDVSGFPGDAFFADQASALTQDIDAVCASFNGLDFWAQPINAAGKQDSVLLATIGSVNDNYVDAFKNGSVDFLAAKNIQMFGFAVPMIVNAVEGNAEALKENNTATNLQQSFWLISNVEDIERIHEISQNEKTYTGAELLTLIKSVNPDANASTLKTLVNSDSAEEIIMRRSMDE